MWRSSVLKNILTILIHPSVDIYKFCNVALWVGISQNNGMPFTGKVLHAIHSNWPQDWGSGYVYNFSNTFLSVTSSLCRDKKNCLCLLFPPWLLHCKWWLVSNAWNNIFPADIHLLESTFIHKIYHSLLQKNFCMQWSTRYFHNRWLRTCYQY